MEESRSKQNGKNLAAWRRKQYFRLEQSQIRSFLSNMKANGRAASTIQKYREDLNRFYEYLGEGKLIYPDSLSKWQEDLLRQGYAARSVNVALAAVNGLYIYLGLWDWQSFDRLELEEVNTPLLSREEYLLLLQEARKREDLQLYLQIKVMACTELTPGELHWLTREAVEAGEVAEKQCDGEAMTIPEGLREELLSFCVHRGIRTGPIFLNGSHKPMARTALSKQIAVLGEEVGLEPGKANPRNLRRMYLATMEAYRRQAQLWINDHYSELLEAEEATAGWQWYPGSVRG